MINEKDTLGQIIKKYPEIASVLAKAGLHCIGCHVSEYESLEDGCQAHGLTNEDIKKIVTDANAKIKEFDDMLEVSFTKKAILEIEKRKLKEGSKYIQIRPVFDGYDFKVTNELETDDVILNKDLNVISDSRTQRFLKGVAIDFSDEDKDFIAKRN
jgi:hybrid cluster-associated redox disulfide protein